MENLATVTYGAPIKKYAQFIPSVDGVSSFFQIVNNFFIEILDTNLIYIIKKIFKSIF
jgi:hypothetical protein